MKVFCASLGLLAVMAVSAPLAGGVASAPSGDTCTATGNGTTYALQVTLPSTAVEQGAFAIGAPGGVAITGIKDTGNPGTYSTQNLPANTGAVWVLTNPTYVAPGSQVILDVTTGQAVGGAFTVVPATAITTGQTITYLDPIQCPIQKAAPPPSNKFTVQKRFQFSGGVWRFVVRVPGAGRVTIAGKSSPKLLIRTRTIPVAAGTTRLTIVPTAAGKAALAAGGALKVKLVVEFKPRGGTPSTQTIAVALRK